MIALYNISCILITFNQCNSHIAEHVRMYNLFCFPHDFVFFSAAPWCFMHEHVLYEKASCACMTIDGVHIREGYRGLWKTFQFNHMGKRVSAASPCATEFPDWLRNLLEIYAWYEKKKQRDNNPSERDCWVNDSNFTIFPFCTFVWKTF